MTNLDRNIMDQEWFQACPFGVLALDQEGRICGINPALETIIGLSAAHMLGHSQQTLPSPAHRALLGPETVLYLHGSGVAPRWLECTPKELHQPTGNTAVLRFYQDVTELQQLHHETNRLRKRVEELAVTDELTGIANQRALAQSLIAQVSRSRRYENPLSLAMVEIVPAEVKNTASVRLPDDLVLAVSCFLRDRLRWADIIGRWTDNRFMLILPETPHDAGRTVVENILEGVSESLSLNLASSSFRLQFGVVEWRKGMDANRLIEQVEEATTDSTVIAATS